ncbi:hypothetical protein BbINS_00870 [Bartonella bacilliformis INS]|uniref:Uncharacterized protein n=2 Tax=Bartonella bacilliformis TaxID=774 RepID=A1URB6_BARBK|nr:hypothetical protein BARBAKC583_0181 [Bartonella bacilliformis KC583]EKS46070.1 hypothetical protein BbINS_00870 [Bartonella bacilliformis INS]
MEGCGYVVHGLWMRCGIVCGCSAYILWIAAPFYVWDVAL